MSSIQKHSYFFWINMISINPKSALLIVTAISKRNKSTFLYSFKFNFALFPSGDIRFITIIINTIFVKNNAESSCSGILLWHQFFQCLTKLITIDFCFFRRDHAAAAFRKWHYTLRIVRLPSYSSTSLQFFHLKFCVCHFFRQKSYYILCFLLWKIYKILYTLCGKNDNHKNLIFYQPNPSGGRLSSSLVAKLTKNIEIITPKIAPRTISFTLNLRIKFFHIIQSKHTLSIITRINTNSFFVIWHN